MQAVVHHQNDAFSAFDPAALLTNIMESATIGFIVMTLDRRVLRANRAFETMIGFNEDELLTGGLDALIHPDDYVVARRTFDRIVAGETQGYQLERRYIRKDGTILHALGAVSVHRASDPGQPGIAVIQLTDITAQKQAEARNSTLHQRLKLAVEASGAGVWDVDFTDHHYHWDARMHELYGLAASAFSGRLADWMDMIHAADAARVRADWDHAIKESGNFSAEYRIVRPSGEVRHIQELAQFVRDDQGVLLRAVGTNWDVSSYKHLNEEIHEEKERLRITLDSIGEAVICTDALANVTFMNDAAVSLTGVSLADANGKPLVDVLRIIDEASGDPAPNPVGQCFAHEASQYRASNIFMLNQMGGVYDIQLSAAAVRRSDGEMIGCVVVFQDVTVHRAAQKKITHNAQHDGLTGLPNRATFQSRLAQAIVETDSGAGPHSLCYIDLDRFKTVNDGGGHAAGDALLKEVSKIIALSCSKKDVPARLGGDEFGLILRNTGAAEARDTATRLVQSISAMEFRWESTTFRVGASVGITEISSDTSDSAVVMHRADLACYSAKSYGRGCVHVYGLDDPQDDLVSGWEMAGQSRLAARSR